METLGSDPDRARKIEVVPYDAGWPRLFEAEQAKIRAALGSAALLIEHVGSTSVPGLAAKPVIDVQLAVRDSADEAAYRPALERAGYRLIIREPEWFEHRLLKGDAPELASQTWAHVQDYANAKQGVIAEIMARAAARR
jgi:GrpB-like predicted nucleotidyltransferase (UPF0157 family)